MSTKQRDPKENPQAGDVIILSDGKSRRVLLCRGGNIDYADMKGNIFSCWITTWREWCRKATKMQKVLHVYAGKSE